MTTIIITDRSTGEVIDEVFEVDLRSWEVYWRLQGNDEDYAWRAEED